MNAARGLFPRLLRIKPRSALEEWLLGEERLLGKEDTLRLSSRETARIFGALSDVTRVEIVRLVAKAPRNVSQLTSLVGVSQPKVSRHLRILRDAGLVRDVRRGKWVWYELAEPSRGQSASTAVAAVSGLFSAATSRGEGISSGTTVSPGFGVSAEMGSPLKPAASRGTPIGPQGSPQAPRSARERTSRVTASGGGELSQPGTKKSTQKRRVRPKTSKARKKRGAQPKRGVSAPKRGVTRPVAAPSRDAKRKPSAPRKRKETPRKELEDFLL